MVDEEIIGGESREEKLAKLRKKYKKPMGCMMKLVLGLVVIVFLLAIGLTLYFQFFWKPNHQDKSFGDFWESLWGETKDTVAKVKDKALEWKDWLLKSENTKKWLDKAFPVREATRGTGEEGEKTAQGKTPLEETKPGEESKPGEEAKPEEETKPEQPEEASGPEVHPELQAAADEFRAGLALFQKRQNNRALDRFRNAQDHLENYRKVNPSDPQIEEFEKELAPYIHAAMKDSTVE